MELTADTKLSLKMVSSRGTKVFPPTGAITDTLDHWRARFIIKENPGEPARRGRARAAAADLEPPSLDAHREAPGVRRRARLHARSGRELGARSADGSRRCGASTIAGPSARDDPGVERWRVGARAHVPGRDDGAVAHLEHPGRAFLEPCHRRAIPRSNRSFISPMRTSPCTQMAVGPSPSASRTSFSRYSHGLPSASSSSVSIVRPFASASGPDVCTHRTNGLERNCTNGSSREQLGQTRFAWRRPPLLSGRVVVGPRPPLAVARLGMTDHVDERPAHGTSLIRSSIARSCS